MRLVVASLILLATATALVPGASAEPLACVPTSGGGLDYHSQACVDVSDARCPVYHESWTDFGHQRTCVG
jgi:hypothetical protein